ncbi:MAG: universal stress protein [Solirubrobacterales bacterium]|nr:universal stress protein [Solirubrobacterales bacterium]
MRTNAIISYDDSQNDHDALMLGRVLRDAGAELTLAYVRHAAQGRLEREEEAARAASALLHRGAAWLDDSYVERHVVMSASTSAGLSWLAGDIGADLVVFGSEYRTRAGHVAIGRSAQPLLENGPVAVGFAPACYAVGPEPEIATIGILRGTADEAAIETAYTLADRLEATVVDRHSGVDLIVAGSRPEARHGRAMLTSSAQNAIEEATAPVLVVARGLPLTFQSLVTV